MYFTQKAMTHEAGFIDWEQSNQGLSQRQLSVCFRVEGKASARCPNWGQLRSHHSLKCSLTIISLNNKSYLQNQSLFPNIRNKCFLKANESKFQEVGALFKCLLYLKMCFSSQVTEGSEPRPSPVYYKATEHRGGQRLDKPFQHGKLFFKTVSTLPKFKGKQGLFHPTLSYVACVLWKHRHTAQTKQLPPPQAKKFFLLIWLHNLTWSSMRPFVDWI